jgi:nucleotide-binding universal stress UspA family protein
MKLILVPTDMSETASHALRYASALAEKFDAHLLVIYADPFMPPLDFSGSGVFAVRREDLIDNAREQLEVHVEQNVSKRVPYDIRVITESPVDAILAEACATGTDLIVMGTHGRSGLTRLLVGSVTEAIIELAPVPVIAVNGFSSETPKFTKVICPVRFTTASLEALRYASTFAENTSLLVFRGLERAEVRDAIDELIALEQWIPKELITRSETQVTPNAATAEAVVEFAKEKGADLIALGVPASGNLLPKLLHLSPCPVLTMNERTVRLTVPERKLPVAAVAAAE